MVGLLDERPGRRAFAQALAGGAGILEARRRERPAASGAQLASELEAAMASGFPTHGAEGARASRVSARWWPIAEPAQGDYEQLRPPRRAAGRAAVRPPRVARAYAYKVLILEELRRFGVSVRFLEGPAHGEDPQATLLARCMA
jgi:hypothetical protein